MRLVASSVAEPAPNQIVPHLAARAPQWRRASSVKQTVELTADRAPTTWTPRIQPSGGDRIE
jgi:hypothetical protein